MFLHLPSSHRKANLVLIFTGKGLIIHSIVFYWKWVQDPWVSIFTGQAWESSTVVGRGVKSRLLGARQPGFGFGVSVVWESHLPSCCRPWIPCEVVLPPSHPAMNGRQWSHGELSFHAAPCWLVRKWAPVVVFGHFGWLYHPAHTLSVRFPEENFGTVVTNLP